ncbi:DUF7260 family protein [Halorubrum lipolyticum]|uniref:DUF7260 domain-containing protein n=1 Tax=Halorubrum lipolyticum DSM 21995 TaxID=1227482 RepID=M0NNE1_9EURY|nr:hypothetical protein [Halorubrum lipolyticum]EMA58684.1 hypothetical protein C469_12710 [Halorubrum lipolyticum DSM 21995]
MSARQGAGIFRIQSAEPAATECTTLSCDLAAIASEPGAVTAVVLAGVVAFVALAYVRDAKADCRGERRRVLDERDAFEEFADRVSGLDPAPASSTASSLDGPATAVRTASVVNGGNGADDVRLRRVLVAYRDTVMALPHYREEYDETVPESLAAELGPDTTAALASNGTLSTGAKSALVRRSRRAVDARESLADAIDAEIDALSRYETDLSRIDRRRRRLLEHLDGVRGAGTDAAIDVWGRLDELESECDEVAGERQRALDDPPMTVEAPAEAPGDGEDRRPFHGYLYGATDGPRYPVLAQVAEIAGRIRADRDRVASRVAGGE